MTQIIKNEHVEVTVSTHGAELQSVKKDGTEILWHGDAAYWGRRSPVLFPFVGQVRDKKYRYQGTEYPMGQHGFARDMEFELTSQTEDTLEYRLCDSAATREVYPFSFELRIGYRLSGSELYVDWTVTNPAAENTLYFSIGAHPAFLLPLDGRGDWADYRIRFMKNGALLPQVESRLVTTGGNVGSETEVIHLEEGCVVPTDELFVPDALVIEDHQADSVAFLDPDGKAYVEVLFDAPIVGVWSPTHKHAPFVCIEPWYGRTDRDDFTGTLEEREYQNTLAPGAVFSSTYVIRLG